MRAHHGRFAPRHVVLGVFVVGVVIYIVAPIAIIVVVSLSDRSYLQFPPTGWSLRWYHRLFGEGQFAGAALFSVWLGVASSLVALVAGAAAAYALARRRVPGRDALQAFFLSPVVIPKIVLGVALFIFFVRLKVYGSLVGLTMAHAVMSLPFVVALLTASFAGMDPSLEEAARDLGAGPIRCFLRVVLPQVKVPILVSGLFAFVNSFDQLESTIFLTRPNHTTLPIAMYDYTLKYQDPTIAALSALVVAFSVALALAVGLLLRRGDAMAALRRIEAGTG